MLLGLPGSEEAFELAGFQGLLDEYAAIDAAALRENLHYFIQQVGPVARKWASASAFTPTTRRFRCWACPAW